VVLGEEPIAEIINTNRCYGSCSLLKIGIVGCGKIADGHVEQIRATGRGEVVCACDQEPLMVEQLATRFSIPRRYSDVNQMLGSEKLDVVHIATPPDSHVFLACAALDAGCHVFLEKPFALDAKGASIILERARQVGKRVSVNYLYNFEPPGLELQRLLKESALGEIVHLDTSYGYNLGGDYGIAVMAEPSHWVHRLPGKLFHNVLDHVLAKVVAHVQDDFSVQVKSYRRRPPSGNALVDAMDDELRFTIHSGAVSVTGFVSAHARPVMHGLKVVGTRDTVELDYAARTLVRSARQTKPSAIGRLFPPWVQARQFAKNGLRNLGLFRRYEFHYFQCMRVLLSGFYDAVQEIGEDPIPHTHILRVCKIIDAIVEQQGANT
jgi:predicted dehydrogenase